MSDSDTSVLMLRRRIQAFVHERDWESFHNPKDLAGAIAIEAAELMELFLWKGRREVEAMAADPAQRCLIEAELADILILCLSLANTMEIDLADAVVAKLDANAAKYPVDLVRGKAHKYTHYEREM